MSIATGAGIVALAIAGVELALRLFASRNPAFASRLKANDLLSVKIAPMGEFGYRQRPRSELRYVNGAVATSNGLGYRGPEVPVAKPAGTLRIILAGGSTTHGWGVGDDQTVDACMRRELAARYPGRRFDVINLGFDGYDSFQDYERIRIDGLQYSPDVIILNNGVNDVRNARYPGLKDADPRTLLWRTVVEQLRAQEARGRPTAKALVKHYLYLAQFASVVRDAGRMDQVLADLAVQTTPYPEAVDYFERNVRRVAALAAERHLLLLLSTPPSAIPYNFTPDSTSPRDYWIGNAAITQKVRDQLDARMRRVASELAAAGQQVGYVEHPRITATMFSDDAHLTPEGNEALSREFCDEIARMLPISIVAAPPH